MVRDSMFVWKAIGKARFDLSPAERVDFSMQQW